MSNENMQNTAQNNVSRKKKDIKTTLRNVLVLILVAVISVAGTLAFLNDQTTKKVNTFTGSAGIDITLTEDNWDNTGEAMAANYTPKMIIPKNPTLKNTSSAANSDEWVALRVDYTYNNGTTDVATTRTDLETNLIETLGIDSNNWFKLSTKESASGDATKYDIYLYKSKLATGATATLFNQVQIKEQDALKKSDGTAKKLGSAADGSGGTPVFDANGKYINFKITLYGAAIKNDASLTEGLTSINTSDIGDIDMTDLTPAADAKDSRKIALALADLLKTLPATP